MTACHLRQKIPPALTGTEQGGVRLDRVQPGDVVRCSTKGRSGIRSEITEIKDETAGTLPREQLSLPGAR